MFPQNFYIGYTNALLRRLEEHNIGKSLYTRKYRPWMIVYCEGYVDEQDAHDREIKLKQYGRVYSQLRRRIQRSLRGAQKVRG